MKTVRDVVENVLLSNLDSETVIDLMAEIDIEVAKHLNTSRPAPAVPQGNPAKPLKGD